MLAGDTAGLAVFGRALAASDRLILSPRVIGPRPRPFFALPGGPDDRLLAEILKVALSHGTAVVTAFDPKRPSGGFPATLRGSIAVSDATVAPQAERVYIAPGRDVPTTEPGGRWFLVNGSSFAAAHVSGLIALVEQRQRSGGLTIVTSRAGPIDACATLLRVASQCDCACGPFQRPGARAAR